MRTRVFFFGGKISRAVAALLIALFAFSIMICCGDKGSESNEFTPTLSECKQYESGTALSGTSFDQDCIEYQFTDGVLHITHINAGFNCCTGAVIDYSIDGDVITITENDDPDGSMCRCNCLFDFEYEITGLEASQYTIKVVEPYLDEDDSELEFTADFASEKSGTFCCDRSEYPWSDSEARTVIMDGHSGCGGYDQGTEKQAENAQTCAVYSYDETGTLAIRHTNAVFNCCPSELGVNIEIIDDLILVHEYETFDEGLGCDCLCPFDLDFTISNLPAGEYTIKFIEPYLNPNMDTLIGTIDLVELQSGSFCIPRDVYPF